jgi:hypothetical protein
MRSADALAPQLTANLAERTLLEQRRAPIES